MEFHRIQDHNLRVRSKRYLKAMGYKFHSKFGYITFVPELSKEKYMEVREYLKDKKLTIRYYDGCFCPYVADKDKGCRDGN